MLKNHHFNIEIAKVFGIQAAVILDQLIYWIEQNEAENTNIYNGKAWCIASYETLLKRFPYFTKRQIEFGIEKLIEKGIIITGNYSKNRFNRTRYFAFSDEFSSIVKSKNFALLCEMECVKKDTLDFPKLGNEISQNCEMECVKKDTLDFTKLGNEISQNCEIDNTKLGNEISQNCEMLCTTSSTTECSTTSSTTEQKSFDKDFCVPPTSQSEVVANGENSPCVSSVSSDCEILPDEKQAQDEVIEQDIFANQENALSVVKPQKVVKAITTETLINQFHIDPQTAHDFMAVRKAKKAPLTYRALQGIEREAQKIGLTLEQALNICIERNWQGFQAHWLLKEKNEVMQSMTDEQKEKEYKNACEYAHKLITALIQKGTIEDKDYHKWGFVFTGKFKECYSIQESHKHLMDAIEAEQTPQQIAIGA